MSAYFVCHIFKRKEVHGYQNPKFIRFQHDARIQGNFPFLPHKSMAVFIPQFHQIR